MQILMRRRGTANAGLAVYRHSRSRLSFWCPSQLTPAWREKPLALATHSSPASGLSRGRMPILIESPDEYLQTAPVPTRHHQLRCLALLPLQSKSPGYRSSSVWFTCGIPPCRSIRNWLSRCSWRPGSRHKTLRSSRCREWAAAGWEAREQNSPTARVH